MIFIPKTSQGFCIHYFFTPLVNTQEFAPKIFKHGIFAFYPPGFYAHDAQGFLPPRFSCPRGLYPEVFIPKNYTQGFYIGARITSHNPLTPAPRAAKLPRRAWRRREPGFAYFSINYLTPNGQTSTVTLSFRRDSGT